jgi:penicillin amidase
MVANSIDATLDGLGLVDVPRPAHREELVTALKHLLEHNGVGVSGLNFFNVPGIDDVATRRDILVLASLADALDLLASDAFAPAFANSENQDDYRW